MRPSVLLVNNYRYVRGGSDRFFLEQARILHERGHRVLTLASTSERDQAVPGEALGFAPLDLRRPSLGEVGRFLFSGRARRAVQALCASERRPDVAHLHIYYGQITASILAPLRAAGVPIVHTLHEYKLVCPVSTFVSNGSVCEACRGPRSWPAVVRRCNRGSLLRSLVSAAEARVSRALGTWSAIDHFLAPSEFMRAKMIAHGLEPERVTTLPYFVDAAPLEPATGAGRHFLYCGRLERLKGVLTLVRASAAVPQVPLLLAGDGEARPELEALLARPGYAHVRLVGRPPRRELERLVRESRCLVCPSEWYENYPLVVLEAMALGRAVIATRVGGLPELVHDGRTGWTLEPGDEAELARLLGRAAREPAELERMGRAGREWVLENLRPQSHYERLMALYRGLLEARGPRP